MKKGSILFFSIFAVIVILFLLTGKTAFLLAACALVIYVLFALVLLFFSGRNLETKIRLENETQKEQPEQALFLLRNNSSFPVFRCDADLYMENLLTKEKTTEKVSCGVFTHGIRTLPFELSAQNCGIIKVGVVSMRTTDPLCVFSRKTEVKTAEDEMMILPVLTKFEISPDQIEQYDMESFRYAEGKAGSDSSETVGIRAYEPGDSVKAIHWKLSAKIGETVIKEYGFPVDARLMVLADKDSTDRTAPDMDRLTEFALSLSLSLVSEGVPHSFGWYDAVQERFVCEDIRSENDLYMLLPGFLRAPFFEDEEGTALRFLGSGLDANYAGYFYATFDGLKESAGLELLKGTANVIVLSPERIEQNMDMDR